MENSRITKPARNAEHRTGQHPQRSRQIAELRGDTGRPAGPWQSPRSETDTNHLLWNKIAAIFSAPAGVSVARQGEALAEIICCKAVSQREATKSSDHQHMAFDPSPTGARDGGPASRAQRGCRSTTIRAFYRMGLVFEKYPESIVAIPRSRASAIKGCASLDRSSLRFILPWDPERPRDNDRVGRTADSMTCGAALRAPVASKMTGLQPADTPTRRLMIT